MMHIYKRVDISIMVVYDDSDVKGHNRRKSELSIAPLHMKQDTTSIPV